MIIYFTESGWINATETCKAFEKKSRHFLNTESAIKVNDFLLKYKSDECICPKNARFYQFESKSGKSADSKSAIFIMPKFISGWKQGTYYHPKLGVKLAEWLDFEFSLWVDEKIAELQA